MLAPDLDLAVSEVAEEFAFLPDWEERYGHLLDLARGLAPLAETERTEDAKVRGCASQAWLVFDRRPEAPEKLYFRGDSDAHLVRGLIATLIRIYSGRTKAEILAAEPRALFTRLGFAEALTPQRSNGFHVMVQRIRAAANAPD